MLAFLHSRIDAPNGRSSMLFVPVGDDFGPAGAIAAIGADGVEELVFHFRDGSTERRALIDNYVYVLLDRWPARLSWTDSAGRPHSIPTPRVERP